MYIYFGRLPSLGTKVMTDEHVIHSLRIEAYCICATCLGILDHSGSQLPKVS